MSKKHPRSLPYRRGVGALLFNGNGEVLVGRRVDTPGNAWQFPQGGVHKRERPRVAVLRELKEEVGTDKAEIIAKSSTWLCYDLPMELLGRVWQGKYRGQRQRWFALRFTGSDHDINLAASDTPEFEAWRWASLADTPSLAVPFKRRLYEDLVAEFSPVAEQLAAGFRSETA
jgi:NTP pyrophosphohydrolases including oxidative damage repair enzymes